MPASDPFSSLSQLKQKTTKLLYYSVATSEENITMWSIYIRWNKCTE